MMKVKYIDLPSVRYAVGQYTHQHWPETSFFSLIQHDTREILLTWDVGPYGELDCEKAAKLDGRCFVLGTTEDDEPSRLLDVTEAYMEWEEPHYELSIIKTYGEKENK